MKKRPRDPNQLAKSIIGIATGELPDAESNKAAKGRAGGLRGGKARAASLDPQKRREIARKAATELWGKK